MSFKTHYDNLKVSRNATLAEIKIAYRRLCSKHHPDKHPEEDKEKQNRILIIINEAYKVLSDETKRKAHDEWIAHVELCKRNAREAQIEREREARARRTREEEAARERQRARQERDRNSEEERKRRQEENARWHESNRTQSKEALKKEQEEKKRQDFINRVKAERREEERIRAAEAKAEAARKKERKEKRNRVIAILVIIFAAYHYFSGKSEQSPQQKPRVSNSDNSTLVIQNATKHYVNGAPVFDIYYDNYYKEFNYELQKRSLKGTLAGNETCDNISSITNHDVTMNYHFLKDHSRMVKHIELEYLCE